MPIGEGLIERVAEALHVQQSKTINEIGAVLTPPVSARAVRYAVAELVKAGRAKLLGPRGKGLDGVRNRQRYRVRAIAQADIREAVYGEAAQPG